MTPFCRTVVLPHVQLCFYRKLLFYLRPTPDVTMLPTPLFRDPIFEPFLKSVAWPPMCHTLGPKCGPRLTKLLKRCQKGAQRLTFTSLKPDFGGPVGDEGDPKESIVANLVPKKTPKWSLKWRKSTTADPHETCTGVVRLHVHPPWGAPFSLLFQSPKKTLKKYLKGLFQTKCANMTLKVPLRGPQKETQIY